MPYSWGCNCDDGQLVVRPGTDGRDVALYHQTNTKSPHCSPGASGGCILLHKSVDYGKTFSPVVTVASNLPASPLDAKFTRRSDSAPGTDPFALVMIVEGKVLVSDVDDTEPTFKTRFSATSGSGLRGPWPTAALSEYHWHGFRSSSNGPQLSLVPGPDGHVRAFTYSTYTPRSVPGNGTPTACLTSGVNCLPFTHIAYSVREFGVGSARRESET